MVSRAVVLAVGAMLAGCVLGVDFDSFTSAKPDGGTEAGATTNEAGAPPDGATTNEAGADAGTLFADDFDRADGVVGNGWTQEKADSYAIGGGKLTLTAEGYGYNDSWLYQPASEAVRDMTVSVELTPQALPPSIPQVHVRATQTPKYATYGAGLSDEQTLIVFRATDDAVDTFQAVTLSQPLKIGDRYRITVSAVGVDPVTLTFMCEHATGNAWSLLGQGSAIDKDPAQLRNAGMFGVSVNGGPDLTYDNFLATVATP